MLWAMLRMFLWAVRIVLACLAAGAAFTFADMLREHAISMTGLLVCIGAFAVSVFAGDMLVGPAIDALKKHGGKIVDKPHATA